MIEIVKVGPALEESLVDFFAEIDNENIKDNFYPHEFTEEQARNRCHYRGKDQYFACIHSNRILAYGMLRGWDEGYSVPSLGICVSPSYQGHGLGNLMMQHLISAAKIMGATQIILKVNRSNKKAIELYKKMGFEMKDENEQYLKGILSLKKNDPSDNHHNNH